MSGHPFDRPPVHVDDHGVFYVHPADILRSRVGWAQVERTAVLKAMEGMIHVVFPITPVPKPRMTQRDKWRERPSVVKYRTYCDALRGYARREGFTFPDAGAHIVFHIPMPPSWSKKRRQETDGRPHQQKPDVDNLVKAVLDALRPDGDAGVWKISAEKRWARVGRIEITVAALERAA